LPRTTRFRFTKKCLYCIYRCKGALNAHESSINFRVQTGSVPLCKRKFDVGLNSFDLNQSQTLLSTAQSDVLRTNDYIFKIKNIGLFGIPIIKTMKETIYLLIGGAIG
jgi:hypothetical protein